MQLNETTGELSATFGAVKFARGKGGLIIATNSKGLAVDVDEFDANCFRKFIKNASLWEESPKLKNGIYLKEIRGRFAINDADSGVVLTMQQQNELRLLISQKAVAGDDQ